MQEQTDIQADTMTPEIDAARVQMHRLIDAAFDNNDATRVVMFVADDERLSMHAVGTSDAELAQIMEIGYAQYQQRFYGSAVSETVQ